MLAARSRHFEIRAGSASLARDLEMCETATRFSSFLESQAFAALPRDVSARLENHRVVITVIETPVGGSSKEPPAEGNFWGDDSAPLRIELSSSQVKSVNASQLLAHEFFHAVHYVLHPDEQAWVREGLAQNFETIVLGYMNGMNISAGLRDFSTPLMGSYDPSHIVRAQFGHDALYFDYLMTHCGGRELFWDLARGAPGLSGPRGIDGILKGRRAREEECSGFLTSAEDFEIARAHNRPLPALNKFHLRSTTLRAEPLAELPPKGLDQFPPYTPLLLRAEGLGSFANSANDASLHVYWLENSYPYSVETHRPTDADSPRWSALVLRTCRQLTAQSCD